MWKDVACECNSRGTCITLHYYLHLPTIAHQELGVPFISVSAPSIVSGMSGESEKTLRETFDEAKVSNLQISLIC